VGGKGCWKLQARLELPKEKISASGTEKDRQGKLGPPRRSAGVKLTEPARRTPREAGMP